MKNKILRQALYRREKLAKLKEKREKRKKLAKEREQLGDDVSCLYRFFFSSETLGTS